MNVDNTGIYSLCLECVCRFKRLSYHKTCCNDCYIIAVTKLYALAKLKLISVLIIEYGCGKSAESHICRAVEIGHSEYCRLSLNIVCRVDNGHAGDSAHKSNILVTLMSSAVFADRNTCMGCAYLYIKMGIAYAVSDYFISSACRKHSKCACEYQLACCCDTCRNAHHVCLCNTAVKEAVGICLLEYTCLCSCGKVCVENNKVVSLFSEHYKSFAVAFTGCFFLHFSFPFRLLFKLGKMSRELSHSLVVLFFVWSCAVP